MGCPSRSSNFDIVDRAGTWLATGDLVWPKQRVCAEVQSNEHHPEEDRPIDEGRRRDLEYERWYVAFMYPEDIFVAKRASTFVNVLGQELRRRSP